MNPFELNALELSNIVDELLKTKRFRYNFCDNIILSLKVRDLSQELMPVKRKLEMLSPREIVESYKLVLLYLMDLLIEKVQRFKAKNFNLTNSVMNEIIRLMRLIWQAHDFEEIQELEPEFKSNVQHQIYKLMRGINY